MFAKNRNPAKAHGVTGVSGPGSRMANRGKLSAVADPGSPARILVVDDDGVNREVAVRMLGRLGYEVEVASNGAEAIESLGRSRFDAVFMDCQMPVMDGYEASRAIRRAEEADGLPRTPIVAMTASESDGSRQRCLAAGMDDHLDKPFGSAALAAVLQRWVLRDEAAAPVADALSDVDLDQLARYGAGDDNADRMERLVERFVTSAREDLAAIRTAVDAGDLGEVARAAHNLAGSSAVVGARGVAGLSRNLEHCAESGAASDVGRLVEEIDTELTRSTVALRAAARGPH